MPFPSRGELLASRYRIEELLGEGSFGRVYLARDIRADEDVAVKILKAEGEGAEERVLRFDREIKTLGRLDHPNILRYIDHGRQADVIFLVVELLRGRSLDDAGRDLLGQSERVMLLGARLARAFAAAHAQGIIHRDIKPENIHLTETGEPRILDYGLAGWDAMTGEGGTEMGTVQKLTRTNEMMGTVPYMSPEQVRAESLDRRTDIFSLAVVLYELVTGRRPYVGGSIVELLLAIETGTPPALAELRPELTTRIDGALEAILRKALDPLPHERFQTMDELAVALETALGQGRSLPADASPAILLPPRTTLAERSVRTMIGREGPLVDLGGLLDGARDGAGVMAVVEAPAGMGKSLLVNELVRGAHATGWLCLTALVHRGRTARREHPLRPWLERAAEIFPADDATATAVEALEAAEAPEGDPRRSESGDLGRALAEAVVSLADRMPLLLVLDDAHLADAGAISALQPVALAVPERRAMLLVTVSPDIDAEDAAADALLKASIAGAARRVPLPPLGGEELARIAADDFPGLELPTALLGPFEERSGGNPLYAHAILRLLEERGDLVREGAEWRLADVRDIPHPPEARDLLDSRLADLEPGDVAILETAAALEREFTPERLAEVLQRPADVVRPRLRFLDVRKHILFREARGYRFDQPLTRDFLLQRLDPERSRELHLRAARTLEARLGRKVDAGTRGSIASHFMQAGRPAEALPHLVRTGLQLRDANDHLEAVRWLQQARAVIEREIDRQHSSERAALRTKLGETEFALGASLHALGRHTDALRHLEAARRIAAQVESQPLKARALLSLASVFLARGDVLQAQRRARQAERASRKSGLDAELARALSVQATATSRLGDDPEEAEELWGEAIEILDRLGRGEDASEIRFRLGNHFFRLDRYDEAVARYDDAERHVDRTAQPQLFARIVNSRAAVDLARRRPDLALPSFEEAAAIRRETGARRGEAETLHNIAYCHHMLGRLDDARETYRRVIALREELGEPSAKASSRRNLAEVLFDMGRLEESLAEATAALDAKRQLEDLGYVPNCLNMLGEIELQLGRLERARRAFGEVLAEHRDAGRDERIAALAGGAQTELLAGQPAESARLFDELERALAEGEPSLDDLRVRERLLSYRLATGSDPGSLGEAAAPFLGEERDAAEEGLLVADRLALLRGRGEIALAGGDDDAASRLFGQALPLCERLSDVEARWRLHERLARVDTGRRDAHLRAALGIIDRQAGSIADDELRTSYLGHAGRAAVARAARELREGRGADARWTADAADRETLG